MIPEIVTPSLSPPLPRSHPGLAWESTCSPFSRSPALKAAGLFLLEMNSLLTLTHFDVSQGSMLAGGPPQLLEEDSRASAKTGCQGPWNCQNASHFYGRAWIDLKTFQVFNQQPMVHIGLQREPSEASPFRR